jgi:hypothetical protein
MKNLLLILAVLLLTPLVGLPAAESPAPQKPRTQFLPDQPWPDDQGVHINAHGGGVMFHEGVYYWFGEHKISGETAEVGVHCYSSTDLYNWKDCGIALAMSDDPASDITKGCILERPKVIYNAATKKFVMWFHLELKGQARRAARSGVAVAERATGPYTFLRSVRPDVGTWPMNVTAEQKAGFKEAQKLIGTAFIGGPNPEVPKHNLLARDFTLGQMAKDMTLFVDDDGKAYHVFASEENSTLHLSQLTDDYLSHSGKWVRLFEHRWHEAPALCKYQGRYWMISSDCSGWDPNTARLSVADSIWGPWKELGNPLVEASPVGDVVKLTLPEWKERGYPSVGGNPRKYTLGPEKTFGGQSTCILPVNGRPGAFIALFDIWRPKDAIKGGYLWLPMKFAKDRFTITWRDAWDLSVFGPSDTTKH